LARAGRKFYIIRVKPFLIYIFLFCSCPALLFAQVEKNALFGSCRGAGGDGAYACTQVELRKNGTFYLYVFYDIGGGSTIQGTYSLNGDTVTVNTYDQPKLSENIIMETFDPMMPARQYKICFFDSDSNKTPAVMKVNDELRKMNDWQNEFLITTDSVALIEFAGTVIGQNGTYIPKNKRSNIFKIYLKDVDPSLLAPAYLTNVKWMLAEDKLYLWKNEKGDFDLTRYLSLAHRRDKAFKE
jgi:hypothetical protein